jgi:trigger factor
MAKDTQEPQADEQAEALPENRVDVEDAGTLKKKVTVTVPRPRIDAKFDEMYGELRQTAQIPGFRVGHAPRRLVEKRFAREVSQDVRNALVGESIGDAIEKAELKTLGEPDIDLDDIELPDEGDMSFDFEVEVAPEFDLPELKGIPVEKPALEVTDERIDEYIDQVRQSRASYAAADAPAERGDAVTVDVSITGEGIEPVHRDAVELRVAAGQVEGIPLVDLPDALEGKSAGESAELTTTIPEAHPNEDWHGKEATVELTVQQVRKRSLPEVDDEFAKSMGFDSLDELRSYMADRMEGRLQSQVQRHMRDHVRQYLLDNTDFDVPEGVAQRHTARLLQRQYVNLLYQGVPREQIDENLAQLQAEATQQAERDLKLSFILSKVAEQEDIEVSEAEINARIAQMASMYGRRPERLRQELASEGNLEQVEVSLREEKALDKLLAEAEVTEVSEEQLEQRQETAESAGEKKPKKQKKAKKKAAKKKSKKASSSGGKASGKKSKKKSKKSKTSSKKKKSGGSKS